jgi:hypothetical protein
MFRSDLILKSVRGTRTWVVLQELAYQTHAYDKIRVPIGFTTDLASVPQLFQNLFPKDGKYKDAAVVHDYLYSTQGLYGKFTRKQSDKIFSQAMKDLGVSWWRRSMIYRAVRIGGAGSWK